MLTATAAPIHIVTEANVTRWEVRYAPYPSGVVAWQVLRDGRLYAEGLAGDRFAAQREADAVVREAPATETEFCDTLTAFDLEKAAGVAVGLDDRGHAVCLAVNEPLSSLTPKAARALAMTLLQHADRVE